MDACYLSVGTVLDGRYRIDSVIDQGGFGITYEATHLRIDMHVAIKELFWNGHSSRVSREDMNITVNDADRTYFEELKQNFLREARIVRDFADDVGIVRILDYFEANKTAYMVMEYIDGVNIGRYIEQNGPLPAETAFRKILPLISSLGRIHESGLIHRDISPDNIMVQKDGNLKLIDFGTARSYRNETRFTTVTKDSYAPAEQYDKHGKQGPWTDIYALCATLYHMVTGVAPVSAVQRMFMDELKAPSALGFAIDKKYEAIIMRGLQMAAGDRFQTTMQLTEEICHALPQERVPASPRRKFVLITVIVLLLIGIGILGYFLYRSTNPVDKFKGIRTETFILTAPDGMSVNKFANAEKELSTRLDEFAGEDNYIILQNGTQYKVIVPLDCFENNEVSPLLESKFSDIAGSDELFKVSWQLAANWEIPGNSAFDGKNQIDPAEFTENTLAFVYTWDDELTEGQRANQLMDFKTRLDALGTPYAFGTVYGNSKNSVVIRLLPEYTSEFLIYSIGYNSLNLKSHLGIGPSVYLQKVQAEVVNDSGEQSSMSLGIRLNGDYDIEKLREMTRSLCDAGKNVLCLGDYGLYSNDVICYTTLETSIDDGCVTFSDFCFEGSEAAVNGTILYTKTLLADSHLPATCRMTGRGVIASDGETLFGEYDDSLLGVTLKQPDLVVEVEQRLLAKLSEIAENEGYSISNSSTGGYFIRMDLDREGNCLDQLFDITTQLIDKYDLTEDISNGGALYFVPFKEEKDEFVRIIFRLNYNYDTSAFEMAIYSYISVDPWLQYFDGFMEKWNSYDWESRGITAKRLVPYDPESGYTEWSCG